MNRTTTLFAAALAVAVFSAPSGVAAPAPTTNATSASKLNDLFGDPVVAKAKGTEIKRSELDKSLVPIKANYTARQQNLGAEQTARGKAFVQGVVDRAGEHGLAPLFTNPDALPTPSEIEAPGLWLARVTGE